MKNYKPATTLLLFMCFCLAMCGKKDNTETITSDSTDVAGTPEFREVKIDARKIGPETSQEQLQIEEAIEKMSHNKDQAVVGYWVGAFGRNKINVAIADVADGKALGYTVCAGNYRPVTGTAKKENDNVFVFNVNEPGTDQYDGSFQFVINTNENIMKGSWVPFKKGVVAPKEFMLKKTDYVYSTEVGQYPEASSRILTEEDVANMLEEELEVMRNEIYARHGYSFKNKDMRQRFDTTQWYVPMGVDIRANLTDIEVQNIDLIYQYEEYYAENYDSYGR